MRKRTEKKQQKKEKQKSAATQKVLVLVLFVAVLVYMGIYVYDAVYDPFSTTTAISYTAYDSFEVSGYVIRDEEVITADYDYVQVTMTESSRVSAGDAIATAYTSYEAYENGVELLELEEVLEQLDYSTDSDTTESAASLDSEIYEYIQQLSLMKSSADFTDLSDVSHSIQNALLKREYLVNGIEGLDEIIETLEAQISELEEAISSSAVTVTASQSGLYSGITDGLETVLTPDEAEAMTTEEFNSIEADEVSSSAVGKLVYGITWYYAAVLDEEQTERFSGRSTVELQFSGEQDAIYTMTIECYGPVDEDGCCVVLLSCTENLENVTQLRLENAEIIFQEYTGLRIPKEALRMNEDNEAGVYCISGVQATFREVEILWTMDEYYIVAVDTSDATALRAGEEVIVSAKNLYEGKIIS